MNIFVFFAGLLIGALAAGLACALTLWEKFMDHGGTLALDEDGRNYKIFINEEDIYDLEDQRYVILKVSDYCENLNRLPDINPINLEENGGTDESWKGDTDNC